jgi:S-adenosyl-L-methionine hydrolase (adenosine-forming)
MSVPVITFLSDYGTWDEFVGVCHGVMVRRCPTARIIDLGHGVARQDVRAGALALRAALPFTPPGVHLAVVDPGVGTPRRAVALRVASEDRLLVGPDNGLLMLAAEAFGGAIEAADISDSPECLRPLSATFHGRDIFAPVAAALADGAPLEAVGVEIPTEGLEPLRLPLASRDGDRLLAHVLSTDGYGNVALDATPALAAGAGLVPGSRVHVHAGDRGHELPFGRTFADTAAGELILYVDARGALAVAVNGGSAAAELGLAAGDELTLRAL